jgi:hypothetical protein
MVAFGEVIQAVAFLCHLAAWYVLVLLPLTCGWLMFCCRLVGWHYHMLAYQVAQVLGVGQDQVLLHWACAKVTASSNTPDDQLKEAVSSKLSKATRPRFAAVAAHAQVRLLDAAQ